MKKILLFLLGLVAAVSVMGQQHPQWLLDLVNQNEGLIDSITPYIQNPSAPEYQTYAIYFHQPLQHSNVEGVQFPLRALVTVDLRQNPTTAVNHVYFSGYNIAPEWLAQPDSLYKVSLNCRNEIGRRYRANHIQLEHRYFDFSSPAECWTNLDYCTSAEAAEDFHAIITGLKKVFHGKWVISGVSKGGITAALQHMYHPEDADIFVPYSAPFFNTDRDTLIQHYWYNNGWSQQYRDLFMDIRRQAVSNKDQIFPIYVKMRGGENPTQGVIDTLYGYYLVAASNFGFDEHAGSDTATIAWQSDRNDSIMRSKGVQYGDTVFAYMMHSERFSLEQFGPWIDTLRKYPDPQQAPARRVERLGVHRPFGITREQWYKYEEISSMAYDYQAKREFGYYNCNFTEIVGPESAGEWNSYWQSHYGCILNLYFPWFATCAFNPIYDRVNAATQGATKPMIFLYGLDDAWTGAAMKDQFVNGSTVHKYILPGQNHGVNWTSAPTAQHDEIVRLLDAVLGAPSGTEEIIAAPKADDARKVMRNGQIVIIRGDKTYTVTGVEL